jgi:hypothetical protein
MDAKAIKKPPHGRTMHSHLAVLPAGIGTVLTQSQWLPRLHRACPSASSGWTVFNSSGIGHEINFKGLIQKMQEHDGKRFAAASVKVFPLHLQHDFIQQQTGNILLAHLR